MYTTEKPREILEFVHFFHVKHLGAENHNHISRKHWNIEARLMAYFRQNFVVYNGVEMDKETPAEIVAGQGIKYFEGDRKRYDRIKYGEEPGWLVVDPSFAEEPCHDCGILKGQYHLDGCDVEECPKCHRSLLGCGCFEF